MTLILDLPKEVGDGLAAAAARDGVPVEAYALRLLSSTNNSPRTGAELVDYWRREGLLGTRPDITDSQAHARAIREAADRLDHL